MPTYVMLVRITPQGKKDLGATMRARDEVVAKLEKQGGRFTNYSTMGPFDAVSVIEAPTDEVAMRFLFEAGASGNIESTTMRAFSKGEVERIRRG